MSIKLVMLDANILISAYDNNAQRTTQQRSEAKTLIKNLSEDEDVRFVTTSLIRYEVLCGIENAIVFEKVKSIIDSYKIFDFAKTESDSAIDIYQKNVARVKALKNTEEPRKYKLDFLHIATAKVHGIDLKSTDEKLNTFIEYLNK